MAMSSSPKSTIAQATTASPTESPNRIASARSSVRIENATRAGWVKDGILLRAVAYLPTIKKEGRAVGKNVAPPCAQARS